MCRPSRHGVARLHPHQHPRPRARARPRLPSVCAVPPLIPHSHSAARVQVTVYALFTLRVRHTTYKQKVQLAWGKAPVYSGLATKYLPAAGLTPRCVASLAGPGGALGLSSARSPPGCSSARAAPGSLVPCPGATVQISRCWSGSTTRTCSPRITSPSWPCERVADADRGPRVPHGAPVGHRLLAQQPRPQSSNDSGTPGRGVVPYSTFSPSLSTTRYNRGNESNHLR